MKCKSTLHECLDQSQVGEEPACSVAAEARLGLWGTVGMLQSPYAYGSKCVLSGKGR